MRRMLTACWTEWSATGRSYQVYAMVKFGIPCPKNLVRRTMTKGMRLNRSARMYSMASRDKYREAINIAAELRKYVPRQRAVLFHGSPYPCAILNSNCLLSRTDVVDGSVAFTRQLHVAVYWARMGRMIDEGQGAVFVLD